MLAANNISAGRIITKMKFDMKSPSPKLLFSPAGAVAPQDVPVIKAQSESEAAIKAIEMVVFKKKKVEEAPAAVAAPAMPKTEITEQQELPMPEPVLRKSETASTTPTGNAEDILKKWSKKA
jgi:hypothetical protein